MITERLYRMSVTLKEKTSNIPIQTHMAFSNILAEWYNGKISYISVSLCIAHALPFVIKTM